MVVISEIVRLDVDDDRQPGELVEGTRLWLALAGAGVQGVVIGSSGSYTQASTLAGVTDAKQGRILVVDDDADVRALLTRYLQPGGYDVVQAADAHAAYKALTDEPPDLVLLDVMLSPDDGLEVLSRIRKTSDVAVILLTGKGAEVDRVLGLKMGADDYVVKPFSPAEVEARISSVLRRVKASTTPSLNFEGLSIDIATREVRVKGELVTLTAKAFDLLTFLASSTRQVFSRDQLLDQVWHSSSEWQGSGTVTEHIRRLRKQIEVDPDHPRWITTVWGVGYRFNP